MTKSQKPQALDLTNLEGYESFLRALKERVRGAQLKAAIAVNTELIGLYWELGKSIVEQQNKSGWGDAVLERLSKDLTNAFPDMRGFSRRNLYRIRGLFLAYREESQFVPQAVAQIPWGHNIVILEKVKDAVERKWYAAQSMQHGWSRAILTHQIEGKLYHRQGKAISNFNRILPPPQSDLASEILKDPYNFDFLTLDAEAHERDLEKGLLEHFRSFLVELGVGFAFVGNQYHLEVGDQDFYIDLLFYHLRLRCFVIIDLKAKEFKPEYAGKMNFYLSAVDDLLRHPDDKPSIGMVLCKTKNKFVAEYALRDIHKPIGIAQYITTESLPEQLKSNLPTIEQIEQELNAELMTTDKPE
jgi:predicted nuclease of restriction endonuclease-like (RecB) superfamily